MRFILTVLVYSLLNVVFCKAQTLDSLQDFTIGNAFNNELKEKSEVLLFDKKSNITLYFLPIRTKSFHLNVTYQLQGDILLDFFVSFPSYLLHDEVFTSLWGRYGKQDEYLLNDATAVYRWHKKANENMVYVASCSITCFPVYWTVFDSNRFDAKSKEKPIFQQLLEEEQSLLK